jgi:hypothetical protein
LLASSTRGRSRMRSVGMVISSFFGCAPLLFNPMT